GNTSTLTAAMVPQLVIDTIAPAAPSAPDLIPASDLGPSNSDNVTSFTTPNFRGTGEANARIELFANGVKVGEGVVDATGNYLVKATTVLAEGSYAITARLIDVAGNVGP